MSTSRRTAVFLDRDGVLNRAVVRNGKPYPPQALDEFEIFPAAEQALQRLKHLGFLLIVVTNQPDIARGTQSTLVVDAMHRKLREALPIDDILVCPHDDSDGCDCRKPLPGLITKAAKIYDIDLHDSYLVGDRWRDIAAANAAGVVGIFIEYHYNERSPIEPAVRVSSLKEAVTWITQPRIHEERLHEPSRSES